MITGVDHVVILVDDLAATVVAYEGSGFDVVRGGEHPRWGTENALIALADGVYLELLAARDRHRAAGHRLWRRASGHGREPGEYGGFMVASSDLAGDVDRLRARGDWLRRAGAGRAGTTGWAAGPLAAGVSRPLRPAGAHRRRDSP